MFALWDITKSHWTGGDVAETARSSATEKGKPRYDLLAAAYADWWANHGPWLKKKTKAINDGVALASIQLGMEGVLASIAEFERSRIQERIRAGLARARAQGRRLSRPRQTAPVDRLEAVRGLPVRAAAKRLGVSRSTLQRWREAAKRSALSRKSPPTTH